MKDLLNRLAPDFTLPVLGDIDRLKLSELRGHVVLLHFWSAECSWSRRADVILVYRMLTWERKGVRVVGVVSNFGETEAEARYEAEKRGVKYPLVLDLDQTVVDQYKVAISPHLFVIDAQGVVRYSGAPDDGTEQQRRPKVIYIDQAVSAVLAKSTPDPAVTPPVGCPIVRAQSDNGAAVVKGKGT